MPSTKWNRKVSSMTSAKIPVVSSPALFSSCKLFVFLWVFTLFHLFWPLSLSTILIEAKKIYQLKLSLITWGITKRKDREVEKEKFYNKHYTVLESLLYSLSSVWLYVTYLTSSSLYDEDYNSLITEDCFMWSARQRSTFKQ